MAVESDKNILAECLDEKPQLKPVKNRPTRVVRLLVVVMIEVGGQLHVSINVLIRSEWCSGGG